MTEASHALEEIRRTELEAARRVEEARERAAEIEATARSRARRLVEEGREHGRAAARDRLRAIVEEAEEQAEEIRARSAADGEELRDSAMGSVDSLVVEMVRVVLAPPSEPGK